MQNPDKVTVRCYNTKEVLLVGKLSDLKPDQDRLDQPIIVLNDKFYRIGAVLFNHEDTELIYDVEEIK